MDFLQRSDIATHSFACKQAIPNWVVRLKGNRVVYRMGPIPMTLSDPDCHVSCLKPFEIPYVRMQHIQECGPMPNMMAAQPNISGALCESSVIPFLVPHRKAWLTSAAGVPYSNAANIGERKTWTQREFYTWQNSVTGKSSRKCIYNIPAHETAKHRAKYGWPPVSDVGAILTPRRETCWNLLGCPKLTNLSQPLVGWSSPYCEDMWRMCRRLTSFFPIVDTCLSCEDIAGQSCAIVRRWRIFGDFCVLSEPRAAHFRPAFQIRTKVTSCVEVW